MLHVRVLVVQVSVTWEQSLANEKGVSNSEGWRLLEDADAMPSDDMIIGNSLMTTMQCSQCNTVSHKWRRGRRGVTQRGRGRGAVRWVDFCMCVYNRCKFV